MLNNRRIAVVEDDDGLRASLLRLLRSLGCDAHGYASADEYLRDTMAASDCVVSDVQMPGTTGLELLRILRERGRCPPVILMTAFPSDAVRRRALDRGASCFIEKPINDRALIACLETALGGERNDPAELA